MKHKNIPFSPPDMSEDEINEVADTLRNGWITTGPKVKEFERQIAEFVGVNKAVCLNSQTACAEMALRVLGVGEGDEVIVPASTASFLEENDAYTLFSVSPASAVSKCPTFRIF